MGASRAARAGLGRPPAALRECLTARDGWTCEKPALKSHQNQLIVSWGRAASTHRRSSIEEGTVGRILAGGSEDCLPAAPSAPRPSDVRDIIDLI
jgi:hypothetical protein